MTSHALDVLEFERVLERVAGRASSEPGRRRVLALRPLHDVDQVKRELSRVTAVMRFTEASPRWGPGPIPDVAGPLAQLGADGALLEPLELHALGVVLSSSRRLRSELGRHADDDYPELTPVMERLVDLPTLEQAIARSVDEEGHVLSTASSELKRIRDRLRGAHAKIVRRLEAYMGSLPERFVVADASVTIRDGRYVIPVRREGKGEVGGIVHDESQTGATLFVEPPAAIEAMNQLRDLEREEAREIRRVLGDLTARVAPERDAIRGAFDALADFDGLHARARMAFRWDAVAPGVTAVGGRMVLTQARHPLLLEGDDPVVPYDVTLEPEERCLVVSGPNTGGKSVFLKATGLIAALTQSGVIPPVGPGTSLPVFSGIFADIGDEQSIARNLSTFSAHLANLVDIVSEADEGSLVLIDEMGTGTDPSEGAALARAVLEELVGRGATTVVSSHLGELKQLDTEGSGIVNASLQFDADRMEPTYRFLKGRPGRSYGLAIARRLGFPGPVLDRAEAYREEGAAHMEDILERLEQREAEVEELVHQLDVERARTKRLREDVEARERTLREAERTAEDRARADARKMLLEARSEVEEAIQDLREQADRGASVDDVASAARRRVEVAADRHKEERRELAESGSARGGPGFEAGDTVRIRATGAKGTVVEVRDGRGLVEVGALRFEVGVDDLERVASGPRPKRKAGGWTTTAEPSGKLEVDLRGMRVDEMELELQRALDGAVYQDLGELRIIHGKGTGALRRRVGEMLDLDARVGEHRMGGPGEGGAGVTVATLRGAR